MTNNNDKVFSFTRSSAAEKILVVVNLSDVQQQTNIDLKHSGSLKSLINESAVKTLDGSAVLSLSAYDIQIFRLTK